MLRQGLFITPRGSTYNFFEVEEQNFYRFDITTQGAEFHTDVEAIIYSLVRRKKTYTYGDDTIHKEYTKFMRDVGFIRGKTSKTSYWDNGKFYQKIIRTDEKAGFLQESILENGQIYSVTTQYDGYTCAVSTVSMVYGVKLEPMNFFEYEEVGLVSKNASKITTPYYPMSLLRAKYDIDHLDGENFYVAHNDEEALNFIKLFRESKYPLRGFDTETTGTDISLAGTDELTGVILAWSPHDAVYIPFRMKTMENVSMSILKDVVDAVNDLSDITVAHNKKFDKQVLMKEGYKIRVKWDTMLLSFIINPVIEKGAHALKELVLRMNGKVYLELHNIFVSDKLIDFSILPEDIVKAYACPDGTNVIQLFEYLMKDLPMDNYKLFEYECDLAELKAEQEYYGMRVDVEKYMKQYENCNYIIEELLKAFRVMTRITGNVNSSETLRDLIYNKMRCKVWTRTKTGQPSTSSATIEKLSHIKADTPHAITQDIVDLNGNVVIKAKDLSEAKYPSLLILSKYKKYIKLKTAFYSRFERTMKTGRVFFWINQNGAASGRQSSPMHQLPPELKDVMISDTDDHAFWGPDYSQVELRMIAYLAGETELIELCKDWHNDIHRAVGSLISNKEMWAITPEERSIGKRRNFGVVYLISEYGLAGQIMGPGYTKEDVKFCKHQLDEFYNRFKRIKRYLAVNRVKVQERGYMETDILKRRRYFKQIFDPDITNKKRASLIRQANNMPVQGTAADLLKISEVNMYKFIQSKGWDKLDENGFPYVRPMLSIHDEIIISAHKSIPCEEIVRMIKVCMEIELDGAPPFFVQPAYMENWGQHDDDSVPMPIGLRDEIIEEYERTGVSKLTYENYADTLNNYRDKQLKDYMENLIRTYGADYKEVGQHVRHPSLTFDLLDRYKKDLKGKDLSHEESIVEACKLYLEQRAGNYDELEDTTPVTVHGDREKFFEEIEETVNFDEYGEVVFFDGEEDEDVNVTSIYDDEKFIDYITEGKEYRVWEIADAIMVDMSGLETNEANTILADVYKYKQEGGFFKVMFLYGGRTLTPGLYVEDLPIDEISDKILDFEHSHTKENAG